MNQLTTRTVTAFRPVLLLLVFLWTVTASGQTLKKEDIEQLKFRYIGPVGNRVTGTVGIPGNRMVYITGAATGGIWKTTDGGITWKPVFDDKPVHSIGALAIAPSDAQVVYAGTGESFIRSNVSIGNGVYKSTDQGETWSSSGLENTGRISKVIVHPDNADIVWVGALGHAYAPQKDRGVYKTTDGGKTWKQVLFVDENTGISDMAIDPSNPRILYAGAWQIALRTWNRTSGGPGSGIYKSTDGGETWSKLTGSGLPRGPVGRISVATTKADPNKVYAIIETGDGIESIGGAKPDNGEFWSSDDQGKTWNLVSYDHSLGGRQAYYTRVRVSPDNPNEVYFCNTSFLTSIDGGKTFKAGAAQPNWDHHDVWIDPTDGNHMAVSGDGGVSISHNRGKSWFKIQLPVAQLYHVTVDNKIPYNVLTNRQDGPSMKGPSRSGNAGFFGPPLITSGMWHDLGGGESGFATPDPVDPDIIWSSASGSGALGGVMVRFNQKNMQFRQVEIWPEYAGGHPAAEVKYRFQWTFPVLVSKHDHNLVYATSQVVHRTNNGGQTWEVISPDLTMNDKSKQQISGGLTPDNIGVEYANVIYAFEESPLKQGLFWAGTNDGLVQISQDNGKNWTNVTKNLPELPPLGTVRNIEASKWSEGKAYLVVDLHEVGNFQPFVYKTTDYGKTWKKITKGIEPGNLNYCRSIKEDPVRKGLLYLGTESTLYISFDEGENWQVFMNNLPHTPFYWLEVQEHFNDLVIGTYGRGAYILDDISPLQQMPANPASVAAMLFSPKDAYRFRPKTSLQQYTPEPHWGQDPPYGASINYWVNADKDSAKLYITRAPGDTVRTFKMKPKTGINRVWWDLESNPTKNFILRTPPIGGDWVQLDKNRTRKATIAGRFDGYLVAPGKYNVTLVAGGQTFNSTINILKDPNSDGTVEDIKAQTDFIIGIYNDLNTAADIVNQAEVIRRQILDMADMVKTNGTPGAKQFIAAAQRLDSTIQKVEGKVVQLKYSGTGQDPTRYPEMIAGKMGYLANTASIADFKPGDSYKEVYTVLKQRLVEVQNEWTKIMNQDLPEFFKVRDANNIKPIVLPKKQ